MTISWRRLGIEWEKAIFTVFVRDHSFTKDQIEKSKEFTINIQYGKYDKKILGICGSKYGRNTDKLKELGLTLENPNIISTPVLKNFL